MHGLLVSNLILCAHILPFIVSNRVINSAYHSIGTSHRLGSGKHINPFHCSKADEMHGLLVSNLILCAHILPFIVSNRVKNSAYHSIGTSHRLAPGGEGKPED